MAKVLVVDNNYMNLEIAGELLKQNGHEVELLEDTFFSKIPVIAFSAKVLDEDKRAALKAGFSGFISKPVDVKTFASSVESFYQILAEKKKK